MDIHNCFLRIAFFVGTVVLSAGAQHEKAGTVNYVHLLFNYDARSVGMAGASVALPGGMNGALANPAVLAGLDKQQGFVGYQLVLDGVWCAPLGYARPVSSIGNFSIMLQGLYGKLEEVWDIGPDNEPVFLKGLSASDEYISPSFLYARSFFGSRLYAGVALKVLYHRINTPQEVSSSKGFAFDLGIQYRIYRGRLIFAAVLKNAGAEVSSFLEGEPGGDIPILFEAGISYIPRYLPALRLAMDVNKGKGDYVNFEPGMEVEIYPGVLFGRVGYVFSSEDISEQIKKFSGNQDDDYIKSNWSSIAAGFGIHTKVQHVTLSIDFGLQFRIDGFPPSPVLSGVIEF